MATKDITVIVNGSIFKCPTDWTVAEAEERIRSRYALHGGGIEKDGIAVRATDLISALTGTLTFAGCQPGMLPFISSGFLGFTVLQVVEIWPRS